MMYRRRAVATVAVAWTFSVAGCLGGGDNGDSQNEQEENRDPNSDDPGVNERPAVEAAFTKTDEERTGSGGRLQTRMSFSAASSTGDIVEYRWDFTGDGSTDETGEIVQQTFLQEGEVTVTLEVEDENGNTDTATREIAVELGPRVVAEFAWDDVRVGEEITLDARASTGDIVEYRWDFTGNGSVDETTTNPVTTYVLDEQRPLSVTLEVEDADGNVDATTRQLVETDDLVSAEFQSLGVVRRTGVGVTLDARASTGDVVEYRWDFTGNGSVDEVTTDAVIDHIFEKPGFYSVELVVEGPVGTDSASRELTIGFPIDVSVETPTPEERVAFDASEVTADEYRWDFTGDGEFEKVTLGPDTSYTFEEEGVYPVTLEAQQGDRTIPGFVLVEVQSLG